MKEKIEKFPLTNPNPVLCVAQDGVILYSNEAGEPLLHEWGVKTGEKSPSSIIDLVKRVISLNNPEKAEVRVEKKVYMVVFHPLPEKECVNISGFDISGRKEFEEKANESEACEIDEVELSDIIDIQAIQSLMDDFYKFAHITIALVDLKGNVLVSVGWQDICTKFHRIHPETCKHCVESDTKLSAGVSPGEFKLYKCKNNMWDTATPIMISGQHVGNIFSGQFFFDNEPLDYELFRSQARKYGFNEEKYIAALEKVPRLNNETVNTGMAFLTKLANMISQLSYSNIKLSQSLAERNILMHTIQESEERFRSVLENSLDSAYRFDLQSNCFDYMSPVIEQITGFSAKEIDTTTSNGLLACIHPDDRPLVIAGIAQSLEEGFGAHEYRFKCKDGKYCWLADHFSIIKDKTGIAHFRAGIVRDVTERKKAEEELKKAHENLEEKVKERTAELEEAYNSLLENERRLSEAQKIAHIGNWDWNLLTDELYWSDEIYRIFQLDALGVVPTHEEFMSHIDPEDRDIVYNSIQKALTGELFSIQYRIKLPDGEKRIIHSQGEMVFDERNSPVRMRGTLQDVTEHKKAEEEIRTLANIVESSNDAIGTISPEGTLITWNKGAEQVYGYSAQEALGKPVSILAPPDLGKETIVLIEKVKQREKIQNYETLRLRKEGKTINVSITLSPVFDSAGKLTAVSFISRDITKRKEAEERLRESEEKYRNIVETANEGILITDNENIITYVNEKLIDMLGYALEDFIERPIWSFISEEYRPIVKLNLEKRRQGISGSYELKLRRKDGSPLWTFLNAKPLLSKDGKYVGAMSMLTDISKRKEAEEFLANIEIARKKEIHHRIKNNLQVISSLLDLQAEQFRNRVDIKNPEVLEAFKESQNRVISMALIHEELYKGEEFETINISPYIQELADNLFLTYRLGNTDISLNMDLEENLLFNMDTAVPLGIIINELISNSLKHAFRDINDGKIQIKLYREESRSNSFIMIVSDNGIGIPENLEIEDLNSLGLQLVNSLVDQLNGKLELKRNNGTEFIIRFTVTENSNQAAISSSQLV